VVLERGALDGDQRVDRHRLGMGRERLEGERMSVGLEWMVVVSSREQS
jgi:hypothetical protein